MAERNRLGLTPEQRTTFYYFTFYMTSGSATAYAGIWFLDQGLESAQIGLLGSVPVFIMLVLNLVVGRIADRADDWRQVIVLGAVLGGIVPLGLFFAHGFFPILVVWTLAAIPIAAIGPVADAAALRMTRRNGTDFGVIRAWGTVGYLAVILLTGLIVECLGGGAFLPFFVCLALLRSVLSLQLPRFRAPKEERTLAQGLGARRRARSGRAAG